MPFTADSNLALKITASVAEMSLVNWYFTRTVIVTLPPVKLKSKLPIESPPSSVSFSVMAWSNPDALSAWSSSSSLRSPRSAASSVSPVSFA